MAVNSLQRWGHHDNVFITNSFKYTKQLIMHTINSIVGVGTCVCIVQMHTGFLHVLYTLSCNKLLGYWVTLKVWQRVSLVKTTELLNSHQCMRHWCSQVDTQGHQREAGEQFCFHHLWKITLFIDTLSLLTFTAVCGGTGGACVNIRQWITISVTFCWHLGA